MESVAKPPSWHLARVAPLCEAKVGRQCEDLGWDAYWPRGARLRRSRAYLRKAMPIPACVMPGYVFVRFGAQPHFDLFGSTGWSRSWRDHPPPLGVVEVGDPVYGAILREQHPIMGALGWVVTSGGRPARVPDLVVIDIMAREKTGEFDEVRYEGRWYVPRWVRLERKVLVASGPLKDNPAVIQRIVSQTHVKVRVTAAWGASFPVEIAIADLEPIDESAVEDHKRSRARV